MKAALRHPDLLDYLQASGGIGALAYSIALTEGVPVCLYERRWMRLGITPPLQKPHPKRRSHYRFDQ